MTSQADLTGVQVQQWRDSIAVKTASLMDCAKPYLESHDFHIAGHERVVLYSMILLCLTIWGSRQVLRVLSKRKRERECRPPSTPDLERPKSAMARGFKAPLREPGGGIYFLFKV